MTLDLSRGGMRQWVMGRDGVKRWTDTDAAVGCDDCSMGEGEYFTHSADCTDDLCALNGDQDSCVGQVVQCGCKPSNAHVQARLRRWPLLRQQKRAAAQTSPAMCC